MMGLNFASAEKMRVRLGLLGSYNEIRAASSSGYPKPFNPSLTRCFSSFLRYISLKHPNNIDNKDANNQRHY
jgi:hypothetical protein